jgi:polyisoprenoid-binding protein YceI
MKKQMLFSGVVVALLAGGYGAYDYYAGNHVEVKEVVSSSSAAPVQAGNGAAQQLNGQWTIQSESEVYFSVTTSKETVNFAINAVHGNWQLDSSDISKTAGTANVDLTKLSSGNGQRDNHIKGNDYLQVEKFPEAKFTVKSFDKLPTAWQEGVKVPFTMTGTLDVKGISKEVTFQNEAVYDQGLLKMQGKTVVTFADFGMKNPHTVMLDTENNVTLQLSLVFKRQ